MGAARGGKLKMKKQKPGFSLRILYLYLAVGGFICGGVLLPMLAAVAAPDKSLAIVLEHISRAAEKVVTVSSRMEQEKHLQVFDEVLKASGRFVFQRPDCWRWELNEPVTSGLAVCGGNGSRWHENGGKVQKFKLKDKPWLQHFATQVTAWTTADFAFLRQQYLIELLQKNPPILKLVPQKAAARDLISSLEITFSKDYRYVEQIIIREADLDYTVIKFIDVIINKPLPPDYFD